MTIKKRKKKLHTGHKRRKKEQEKSDIQKNIATEQIKFVAKYNAMKPKISKYFYKTQIQCKYTRAQVT